MSLLVEPPPKVATVVSLLLPRHMLLLPLLHLSLLCLLLLAPPTPLWLDIWRMTSSGFLWPFWILDLKHLFWPLLLPLPCTLKAHLSGLWKLGSRTFIGVKLTWSVTISSSNAKITLPLPMPWAQTEFYLRLPLWKISLCINGSNTSVR